MCHRQFRQGKNVQTVRVGNAILNAQKQGRVMVTKTDIKNDPMFERGSISFPFFGICETLFVNTVFDEAAKSL